MSKKGAGKDEFDQTVRVKTPKSFSLWEVEMTGDIVILRGSKQVFGEVREVSLVYKRVK